MDLEFWRGKRVFVTGHTGFKGSWLSLWLQQLGAEVVGFSQPAPTEPSLFEAAQVAQGMTSLVGDVRDLEGITQAMDNAQPEIVLHLAAQPLVRYSYQNPVETYATNVMGTVNVLEAVRHTPSVRVAVIITSDKCYENREWVWGYRENEAMGGHDPYSNSKGCAELVTAAYRSSFFAPETYDQHRVAVASVRAGNVIGGGDWALDRLIPDMIKAFHQGQPVLIRNPHAIRPWQHVLEPLGGYLLLAEKLWHHGPDFVGGWNFGPHDEDAKPVSWIVDRLTTLWGDGATWELDGGSHPHEAHYLKLDCSKAKARLGWEPRLTLADTLEWVVEFYQGYYGGQSARSIAENQIQRYQARTPGEAILPQGVLPTSVPLPTA
ncbi:CDP-glucose 4,6-dehydratase [Leptolyngbya sp. BL0902]|uniref:CDP-glucose 4,6-dehydratase n=1 Tax=Leptolyngbya sp. BL0902 TaxID=1115757 RepID=UPI0018E73F84|nr:CDP-glucose 4,6-dehydratase [Leptolyngbya sp. BL0902]QQE67080.1 CDP-glucose 4,6-dehydratase [Leptolyngbya sp. BL0902]